VIQKKICMLGAFAVGKTSLVARFVRSTFSDKYLTTVGVKIDRKDLDLPGTPVTLMLWDLAGEDEFNTVQMSYLRGSAGLLIVADGTRAATLDKALELRDRALAALGPIPFLLIVNKADLADQWEIDPPRLDALAATGVTILRGSAKTGEGVEVAFRSIAERTCTPAP